MAASSAPASASHDSQSLYGQEVKKKCRCKLIEHAVRCLTTERDTSACVQRDHVQRVWNQVKHQPSETGKCFNPKEREDIEEQIKQWEVFHESQIQTRKPSDLRVCYLGGDNPINDLQVLVDNGILCQNVWAIEKNAKTLEVAWGSINRSNLRNVRLFKGDILDFLKDFEGQFDIIYFDACGTLPSAKQNTLKFIGYVFLYNKLTSPGALITNFSFPPKQTEDGPYQDERKRIRELSAEYLKYRLENTFTDKIKDVDECLSGWTVEDIYSDYITYQVIDSAYLFIPAQRMLGKSYPLWDQMFVSKDKFLKEVKVYSQSTASESDATSKHLPYDHYTEDMRKAVSESYLRKIGDTMDSKTSANNLCKAWVKEIFPDWESKEDLEHQKLSSLLLTHLLYSSEHFILKFANENFEKKCIKPLSNALETYGRYFPGFYNLADDASIFRLVCGLLYGQMAYPSFPVVDKLLRLNYTAKKRQMFSDVFIFDKCRYVYEQFPSVDCSSFAILELQQQMVFRMAVDGFSKHLRRIYSKDLFPRCDITSINAVAPGGVKFPNSLPEIPERQIVQ